MYKLLCSDRAESRDLDKQKISTSPNPFSHELKFNVDQANILQIELTDLTGTILMSLDSSNGIFKTDNLCAGIYFLRVVSDNGITVQKLIKQ